LFRLPLRLARVLPIKLYSERRTPWARLPPDRSVLCYIVNGVDTLGHSQHANPLKRPIRVLLLCLSEHALPGPSPGGNLAIDNGDLLLPVVLHIGEGKGDVWFFFIRKKYSLIVTF
jgi:hypothetical protein